MAGSFWVSALLTLFVGAEATSSVQMALVPSKVSAMTQYLVTMLSGGAVLWFNPVSKDRLVRKSSTALAGIVFALGLVGFMTRLILPVA